MNKLLFPAGVLRFSLVLLTGLTLGFGALAADSRNQFGIRGAGLISCEIYEKERAARSTTYLVIAGWIDGYITGVNQKAADTYDIASFESTELLTAILSQHCKKNPGALVFAVLNSFFIKARDDRIRTMSPKMTITADQRSVRLYAEVVRRVQVALKAKGHYQGKVNGTFDKHTVRAVNAFQKAVGFKMTGFPDQATLWRLLRKSASDK